MTQDREGDGDEDGVETSEVFVGDNGTDDGCAVCPERVELTDTEGCTLPHAQRAWLTLWPRILASGLWNTVNHRQVLLNEVGVFKAISELICIETNDDIQST